MHWVKERGLDEWAGKGALGYRTFHAAGVQKSADQAYGINLVHILHPSIFSQPFMSDWQKVPPNFIFVAFDSLFSVWLTCLKYVMHQARYHAV